MQPSHFVPLGPATHPSRGHGEIELPKPLCRRLLGEQGNQGERCLDRFLNDANVLKCTTFVPIWRLWPEETTSTICGR